MNVDKNFSLKWIYGDFIFDTTKLCEIIDNYLNFHIEPTNEDFKYETFNNNVVYYDINIIKNEINKKRDELKLKLERIDEFEKLIIKLKI